MSTEDNVKKRYDLLEYIDTVADEKGDVLLQTRTFSKEIDPLLINMWLQDLNVKGLIQLFERTDIDNYSVYRLKISDKNKFRDYVDELYRWIKLSVETLSTNNFLAVLDVAYELQQKLEVSRSNTVDVADTANTKRYAQLKDETIDYRSNALNFLQDYGAINKLEHDGLVFYHVTVTRRLFDRTYQTIMTRAVQDGYATYKKDKALTKVIAEESKLRQAQSQATEQKPAPMPLPEKPQKTKRKITFDAKTSTLSYGKKECLIPDESLEHYVCKLVFKNRKVGAKEIDILDAAGIGQDSLRPVYDAHLRVNTKVKTKLDIPKLLTYRAAKVRLNKVYQ